MQIDLHGYYPSQIVWNGVLVKLVQQCWEMGETELQLIHGHGLGRGKRRRFYKTRTGAFGLAIRRFLRRNRKLRQWIKYTTLDCRKPGATSVKLKRNPAPTRTGLDAGLIEDRSRLDRSESRQPIVCSRHEAAVKSGAFHQRRQYNYQNKS